MVHTLRLDNYFPTPRKLVLGTNSSFGTESIKIERGAGWDELNLTATWHIPGREEPLRVALLDGDAMDVPPEVTKEAKDGVLVLAGLASGVQRASCNVEYLILEQAGVYGGADAEPTPELAAQVLEAALQAKADAEAAAEDAAAAKANADKAQADAEKAQQAAENAAANAAKAGPYAEAARAAQEAAESARDEAIAAQQAAENAAAAAAASKSAADTLAAEAARAARAAENSKTAANNAADLAGENATAAQQAAATATAAANDAGQSASDAAASKAAAETAAKAAQDAQTAAAEAKAETVKAQGAAQTAAKSAQDAKAAAEKARDEAKTAQKGAEAARDTAAKSAEAAAKSEANAKQSADTLAESVENVVANTAAVAELKQQVKNITPDDSTIGGKPWSSKHIIDMLCPPLEESGNPVVCYPVAGYALGVKAKWEPMQEGSGTPSPENIRPIKGRDSVKVERCGENVIEFLSTEDSNSDIKIAVDAEKNITLNGTISAKRNIIIGMCRLHWVAGKTYTMYVKKVSGSVSLGSGDGITFAYSLFATDYEHYFRGGTNSTNLDVYIASDAALVETELVFMLQCWRKGTVFNNFKFQIEVVEGTTTPSTYAPYNGQTNTLTLPEAVYGGEVDAVSSEGQETQKLVILNGTESWNSWGINAHNPAITGFYTYDINDYDAINSKGICSHLETPNQDVWGGRNAGIGFATVGSSRYFMFSMMTSSLPDISAGHEVASLKAYLAAQNDAGTPVQIAYKLAEPIPFTATGAQPLPALAGVNTVLTDADSATVTGRADPIKRITDLEDAVASQT
nr:MAG TPA: hypothetical protein [Caudoviricetes sp.]